MKIKEEINKLEIRKRIEKINKTKSWFFEKVNKMAIPWLHSIRGKKEPK